MSDSDKQTSTTNMYVRKHRHKTTFESYGQKHRTVTSKSAHERGCNASQSACFLFSQDTVAREQNTCSCKQLFKNYGQASRQMIEDEKTQQIPHSVKRFNSGQQHSAATTLKRLWEHNCNRRRHDTREKHDKLTNTKQRKHKSAFRSRGK